MARHVKYSEFRDRIDIEAFEEAIGFAPLYRNGDNDVGYCLFPENHQHGDTTGKFAIHREKRVWNCFVCDGGDLVSLVMLVRNCDSGEAVDWLYQFAVGDTRTDDEFADYLVDMLSDEEQTKTRLPYFNKRVLERFSDVLAIQS